MSYLTERMRHEARMNLIATEHWEAHSCNEILIDAASRIEALESENAELRNTVEFVQVWAWRADPPNANTKLTDTERFSVIKHYPSIKRAALDAKERKE